MGSLVLTVLSVALGLFFVLVGTIKLSPLVSQDVHKEMTKGFVRYVKVFPLSDITGWRPKPHTFRKVIGITEVVCGLVLAFIPGRLKKLANLILLSVLVGALYIHYAVGDPVEKSVGAIVFTLLLITRLIISRQAKIRERREKREREDASSTRYGQKKAQ